MYRKAEKRALQYLMLTSCRLYSCSYRADGDEFPRLCSASSQSRLGLPNCRGKERGAGAIPFKKLINSFPAIHCFLIVIDPIIFMPQCDAFLYSGSMLLRYWIVKHL